MIVSASYRTDIPAFYGRWFMARLDDGVCRVENPYGGAGYTVRLDRSVDGFVFWTKNLAPFAPALVEISARRFPFVVHYTITGYPRAIEASVTAPAAAIGHMHDLSRRYGARVAVWRYDPILISAPTPADWHAANFARLADRLAGATDEVVISFAHPYRKTRRNLARAAAGLGWTDPAWADKRALASELASLAAAQGMRLTICAQPEALAADAAPDSLASCIDAKRMGAVSGRPIASRTKGNRPFCRCAESRDIGAYDTCPHGCVYCYAVHSQDRALRRFRAHDPAAPGLGRRPGLGKKPENS